MARDSLMKKIPPGGSIYRRRVATTAFGAAACIMSTAALAQVNAIAGDIGKTSLTPKAADIHRQITNENAPHHRSRSKDTAPSAPPGTSTAAIALMAAISLYRRRITLQKRRIPLRELTS